MADESGDVEVRIIGGVKGRGLFALRKFKAGETIFEERPLVCSQFLWNQAYGYLACDFCMKPLESAEENARRLTGNHQLTLPYPECCMTRKEDYVECPYCECWIEIFNLPIYIWGQSYIKSAPDSSEFIRQFRMVAYCCLNCRDQAWEQYHQVLCLNSSAGDTSHPLEQLQDAWRHMHYPPETASIMLIARMVATVKQAKDKAGASHLFSLFCHKTVNEEEEIAHKLLGEQFQELETSKWKISQSKTKFQSLDVRNEFAKQSVQQLISLVQTGYCETVLLVARWDFRVQIEHLRQLMTKALQEDCIHHWFTPEGFQSLIALVGTNGQGLGTSALSVWVKNCDVLDLPLEERKNLNTFIDHLYEDIERETGSFLNNEGSGLYPLQSSCNHSCVPNAEATFPYNDFTLVMEAVRDIAAGEEILVCYLDECNRNRSRHSRIKILRENYLFTCDCPKCEAEASEPDVTSDSDLDVDEARKAQESYDM